MKAALLALVLSASSTSFAEPAHPHCGGDGNHQADSKQPPSVFKAEQKVGTKATCPISGEEFTIAASTLHSEYKGKHVYFCCPGCKSRFDKDPEKYLAGKA
jgi:YHS domain-containing protein